MSLSNASVLSGATITPSGGTALAFEGTGIRGNSHTLVASADTNLLTRRSIVCTVKEPRVSPGAPNGYTQARATAVFKSPLVLDNGNTTVNTVRIEVSYDSESTAAEVDELLVVASQILSDSDFASLFGSLSLV